MADKKAAKKPENIFILNQKSEVPKFFKTNAAYDAARAYEDNEFGSKLQEARKRKKMSQQELAQELVKYNISVLPSTISKWEGGINMPNPYAVFALCYILDIKSVLNYFTGGAPERDYLTAELNSKGLMKVQEYTADLIASGNYAVVRESAAPYAALKKTTHKTPIRMISKPVSYLGASAGVGNFLEDENFHEERFPASAVPSHADFAVRVDGDSMMPVYTDGSLVWVEKCEVIDPGEVGIFALDGKAYIKQLVVEDPDEDEIEDYLDDDGIPYNKVSLVSFNDKYEPILITADSEFRVFGRVLN